MVVIDLDTSGSNRSDLSSFSIHVHLESGNGCYAVRTELSKWNQSNSLRVACAVSLLWWEFNIVGFANFKSWEELIQALRYPALTNDHEVWFVLFLAAIEFVLFCDFFVSCPDGFPGLFDLQCIVDENEIAVLDGQIIAPIFAKAKNRSF